MAAGRLHLRVDRRGGQGDDARIRQRMAAEDCVAEETGTHRRAAVDDLEGANGPVPDVHAQLTREVSRVVEEIAVA